MAEQPAATATKRGKLLTQRFLNPYEAPDHAVVLLRQTERLAS